MLQIAGLTSLADLDAMARARLYAAPPDLSQSWAGTPGRLGPSDFDLNPDLLPTLAATPPPRLAAVVVPIVLRSPPTVLLTRRTDHLARHAGQVAFPGGRQDETDADLRATALRELAEETGISARHVIPLGYLDWYRTGTGYAVCPLVAALDTGFTLAPDANEVADIFEVPLAFVLDPANLREMSREFSGTTRHFYAMTHGEHLIWGATAGIIRNFCERLREA
ncbi:MAG: CoA pyrophosphatase [Hyphomicrobiaceae bacterium]|nr:CoA pyrophosphatase [Hyphomicrobiaceae bacterium]